MITHLERLQQAERRILVVQFGGAAGTLAALGKNGSAGGVAIAGELALALPILPWHVERDAFAEMSTILGLICGSLSKFAYDVILLMQTEVGGIFERDEDGRRG